jgi:hypothetical protein
VQRLRDLADGGAIKSETRLASCSLGQWAKRTGCSHGTTGLRARADVDDNRETPATQPVLKLERRWTSPVRRRLASAVDDRGHACVRRISFRDLIRIYFRETQSVERLADVVVRLTRPLELREIRSVTPI